MPFSAIAPLPCTYPVSMASVCPKQWISFLSIDVCHCLCRNPFNPPKHCQIKL
uniref:Uncharacterized protein n=1 Tax=Anguilla anguilla TaxID=7936 RepID=A0A0E9PJ74_ANGAN